MPTSLPRTLLLARLAWLAALAASGISLALAADWPSFRPGQWQFDRTMEGAGKEPQKVTETRCVDPTADQQSMRDKLTRIGCTFSPVTHSGTTYRHTATCKMAGMTTTSDSVLEMKGTDGYTVTIDSVTGNSRTHEVLTARRVGDCEQQAAD